MQRCRRPAAAGAYRALVAARAREAADRGTPVLVTHAGQMSRPILERLGFKPVSRIDRLLDVFPGVGLAATRLSDTPRMSRALPTGTVTLLFTDIEGSTRLLRDLGTSAYADALAEHRRVLRDAFTAEGGVEVDTQGDAFFVSFPTAAGAVVAATAAQEALAPGPIAVRMGLHTGTPTVAAEGYVGIDVHRGARVAALAHGGQVILSATTAALVDDQPLRDLGRHRLKDFDAPAQLFQLGTTRVSTAPHPGAVDLPTPATQFLGRERELFDAASLWLEREPRLLTIVGPGGTGKTRFSIELARFLADEADAGTVFVPLAPVRDAALVVPLIAAHLGASGDTADAVATRLGDKQAHVVLDNLEQLLPDAARPIAELLAAAPSLRILATSREPLRIAGEVELDLPPMVEADAVTLFLERAQAIRADIGDTPAVHELIQRLDGLPLAIELAAARVKLLGPEQLLERIGQRLDLLKGGRDADERHATLRATIAWSYDLLDEEEQTLFARLAVFRGGATLENAEEVCGADLDTLASLLDKSLVRRRTDADGEERFWMLETIREFARERLDASGEENELRREQCDRLIALADRAGTRAIVKGPLPWRFDLIAPEIDNVRAVLDWALDQRPIAGTTACDHARDVLGRPRRRRRSRLARTPTRTCARRRAHASGAGASGPRRRLRHPRRCGSLAAVLSGEPRAVHGGRRGARSGAHAIPDRSEHGDERRTGDRVATPRGKSRRGTRARPPDRRVPGARLSRRQSPPGG